MISNQGYRYIDVDTLEFVQDQEIPEHSQIAVIDTSLGEIRAVLYPEYAPQTVAQFVRLAQEGYYDNTYIFEAKNDVYFAAGSIDSLGSLPEATICHSSRRATRQAQSLDWNTNSLLTK